MSAENGFAGITLNGTLLRFAVQNPAERRREVKSILEGGPGGSREHLAWQSAGYPVRTYKRSWALAAANVRDFANELEELLAGSGPHRLCWWKRNVTYAFLGDGVRLEFFLPHDLIIGDTDVATALTETPHGPLSDYYPVVKVGINGSPLTFDTGDSTEYASGASAGDALFLDGGARFKLESAPAAGALVFARYTPYFAVLERGESEKRYSDNAREPRALDLLEV